MTYANLLSDLKNVDFDREAALDHLSSSDAKAIKGMFAYPEHLAHNGNVDDGFNGDRQSNGAGGKSLFAASQGSGNVYRHTRLRAYNGSYVPVISLQALRTHVCATLDQLITEIATHTFKSTANWPAKLKQLWRNEPHGNWFGDLPEARITEGERAWEKKNRERHGYKMNEWQIILNGKMEYPFSSQLADDPGAIRLVSVASSHALRAMNWHYTPPEDSTEPVPAKFQPLAEGKQLEGQKFRTRGESAYKGASVARTDPAKGKKVWFGLPPSIDQSKKQADYTRRLYNRAAIRFYFSFNHYRTIQVRTSQGDFVLNPWFAIMRD